MLSSLKISLFISLLIAVGMQHRYIFASEAPTTTQKCITQPEQTLSHTQKHLSPSWLKPYSASYTIFRDGDKSGFATRSLKKIDHLWELTSYTNAKVYFFKDKRTEKSTFYWDESFQADSYLYEIKNSFKKKITKEFFDWDLKIVKGSRDKDRQWQFPTSKGLADPLNHQILIREKLLLRTAPTSSLDDNENLDELSFNVTSKGQAQLREYKIIGEEMITTLSGSFETIKLERKRGSRKTIFWMAKKLNFIPVKIYQEKNGDEQATMILNHFEYPTETP